MNKARIKETAERIISSYADHIPGLMRKDAAHSAMLFVRLHLEEGSPHVNRVFWGNVNTYLCEVFITDGNFKGYE